MQDIELVSGHRERLRARLLRSKVGTLPDYEILELILFFAKPRGDTKPLAKKLIKHFGSFGRVLNAVPEELLAIEGVGNAAVSALRVVREGAFNIIKEDMFEAPILSSWKSLIDYCRATMGHLKTEQFRVLYLNKKNMVISDELQEYGTVDHVALYPREIAKRVLLLNASAIILVHNHPTGDTKPSVADIEATKGIIKALDIIKVAVHDHIIISSKSYYSFKSHGII